MLLTRKRGGAFLPPLTSIADTNLSGRVLRRHDDICAQYARTHTPAIFAFNEENEDSPDQIITAAKQELRAITDGLSVRSALEILIGLAVSREERILHVLVHVSDQTAVFLHVPDIIPNDKNIQDIQNIYHCINVIILKEN